MIVRLGTPKRGGRLACGLAGLAPLLISANALWEGGRFRLPSADLAGVDIALDSAGFVAWARYGGYRWSAEEYVDLAGSWPWAWWAAMDACCEPEIASDAAEVQRRIVWTAESLGRCRALAAERGVAAPVPVLQGWTPDDYARSVEVTGRVLGGAWPGLVAVGSVCRRSLHGESGLLAVLGRIAREIPAGVGVHLFGVKGSALRALSGWPLVVSTDSQAWDMAARQEARKAGRSCTTDLRLGCAAAWIARQRPVQVDLWTALAVVCLDGPPPHP